MEYKTKTFAKINECLQILYIIIKATPWSLCDKWCGFIKMVWRVLILSVFYHLLYKCRVKMAFPFSFLLLSKFLCCLACL